MKRVAVVTLTEKGFSLGDLIYNLAPQIVERFTIRKLNKDGWNNEYDTLASIIDDVFRNCQGIIMIMATGIAVRVIAPFLQGKDRDPAVVVMDENNNYAISLVSGHLGGANRLAHELAILTGCQPVITTATDINNLQAIDVIAGQWKMKIEPVKNIKYFNKALLAGHSYTFWTEEGICLPESICSFKNINDFQDYYPGWHVLITPRIFPNIKDNCIILRPQNLVLGIGCRKKFPRDKLMEIVYDFFLQNKLSIKSLSTIATIDIKKKEEAFLYLSSQLNIPLITYSREELNECFEANKDLSSSPFVKKKVGVKGVCEPAAILGANNNKLLINKTIKEGVTLALAVIKPYFITTDDYSWFTMG